MSLRTCFALRSFRDITRLRLRASPGSTAGPTSRVTGLAVVDRVRVPQGGLEVFTGSLALDLLLGDVHSLKQKRSVVRPIVAELRRRYDVSAAEAGHLDLHRRALIGVAVVAADAQHVRAVLSGCERFVADRPEVEVLSAHTQLHSSTDE